MAKDEERFRLVEISVFYEGQEARAQMIDFETMSGKICLDDGRCHVKGVVLIRYGQGVKISDLQPILKQFGAIVVESYPALQMVRVRLPENAEATEVAEILMNNGFISEAEPDHIFPFDGEDSNGTVLVSSSPTTDEKLSLASLSSGAPTIAVMDSGLMSGYSEDGFIAGTFDAVFPGTEMSDDLGHGTQMALIAAGVVIPLGGDDDQAEVYQVTAIRSLDNEGATSLSTLIKGVDYAVQSGADVLSLSWGTDSESPMMQSVMDYAEEQGLLVVAAAGNTPTGKPVYPAAFNNVIGVGALTPDGKIWEQSNFGDFVSVYAPGTANMPVGYKGEPGIYAGTSIATAYTARKIAKILAENPKAEMREVLNQLKDEAD